MNKYYLYKKVLTSPVCTAELEATEKSIFGETTITLMEAYKNRVETINCLARTLFVEDLVNVSGEGIKSLLNQAWSIEKELNNTHKAEILIKNGHKFIEVLEDMFGVTLAHINNYEKAEELLSGKRLVPVVVDRNNNGLAKPIRTEIENNEITIDKCREITSKIRALGYEPKELKFLLSIYTESEGNELGDTPEECLIKKDAYYYVESDCLKVTE